MVHLPLIRETGRVGLLAFYLHDTSGRQLHNSGHLYHLRLEHRQEPLAPPLRTPRRHIVVEPRVLERLIGVQPEHAHRLQADLRGFERLRREDGSRWRRGRIRSRDLEA